MYSYCSCGQLNGHDHDKPAICRDCGKSFGFTLVSMSALVGPHVVDARAEWIEGNDSRHNVVRIDGDWYEFREDPDDGYRSSCDMIRLDKLDAPAGSTIEFPPMMLEFRESPSSSEDVIRAVDERTGLVVLEAGTDQIDDYYPSYVFRWDPTGWRDALTHGVEDDNGSIEA